MKNYLLKILLVSIIALPFISCDSGDDDAPWTEPVVTTSGAYILYNGDRGQNNAKLGYYDIETGTLTSGMFGNINGQELGDVANDMVIYGSKMYITVTNSNMIFVTVLKSKILNTISVKDESVEPNVPMEPRSVVAHNGKVYVSTQLGYVLRIDTTSMTVDNKLKTGGTYSEQMTVVNNKLYVVNSGWGVGKTVSVIALNNFEKETDIEVVVNPVQITSDASNNIYVISSGDYYTIKPTLQKINPNTKEVTVIGTDVATQMTVKDDKLLLIYMDYVNPNKLYYYDIKQQKVIKESFVEESTDRNLDNVNAISIDPVSKDIYLTTYAYAANGTMYVYSSDGKYKSKFSLGEYFYPAGAYFLTETK